MFTDSYETALAPSVLMISPRKTSAAASSETLSLNVAALATLSSEYSLLGLGSAALLGTMRASSSTLSPLMERSVALYEPSEEMPFGGTGLDDVWLVSPDVVDALEFGILQRLFLALSITLPDDLALFNQPEGPAPTVSTIQPETISMQDLTDLT